MEDLVEARTPENYTIRDLRNPFGESKEDEIKWVIISPDQKHFFMINKQKFGKLTIATEEWVEVSWEEEDFLTVCSQVNADGDAIAYIGSKMGVVQLVNTQTMEKIEENSDAYKQDDWIYSSEAAPETNIIGLGLEKSVAFIDVTRNETKKTEEIAELGVVNVIKFSNQILAK